MAAAIPAHIEAASTLAVIASSNEPLLFLAADLTLIAASASFCRAFQIDPASIPDRQLSEIGSGEWDIRQVHALLKATASGVVQVAGYEIELVREGHPPRCLVLNARKLDDGDDNPVRLLLAITDITIARAEMRDKDNLIREKAILLQEVQHRVANSLQIIASVLMQSARRVQSIEARTHLRDAHSRVMSIAALQRHLAEGGLENVSLRAYFAQLCESLAASMVFDPTQLSIVATVDDSVVSAHNSVSLGLIITELVINALKHAFPEHRAGKIRVAYHSDGEMWTLSVTDNGVGMPTADKAKPGLGTGIVDALARQLGATVSVDNACPGTAVAIVRDAVSSKDSDMLSAA